MLLMYSALLPVGQRHLPAMNDSQRKNRGGPAVPETKLRERSHAGGGPMRGRIERQDYSNKLKIAGTRMGFLTIPVHPPPPTPLLTNPPLLSSQRLADQQADPQVKEGGGGERGEASPG